MWLGGLRLFGMLLYGCVRAFYPWGSLASICIFAWEGGIGISGGAPSSYPLSESTVPVNFGSSSYDNHGFAAKISKDRSMEVFPATPPTDFAAGKSAAGKPLDHGGASTLFNANKIIQVLSYPNTLGISPSSLLPSVIFWCIILSRFSTIHLISDFICFTILKFLWWREFRMIDGSYIHLVI